MSLSRSPKPSKRLALTNLAPPRRHWLVGTPVSLASHDELLALIDQRDETDALCIAFCNVHSVMSARTDAALEGALQGFQLTVPDGLPLVWGLRLLANPEQEQVRGTDFMSLALREGVNRGWRHYFYGATDATLLRLTSAVNQYAPGTRVVGSCAPPFGPLTDAETRVAVDRILAAEPDLVWVGLGMPKQELWIARVRDRLPGKALLGVGAAFDFLSGSKPEAPRWARRLALEWAYRLWQEPRRLWSRYLINNPAYLALLFRDVVALRLGRRGGRKRY